MPKLFLTAAASASLLLSAAGFAASTEGDGTTAEERAHTAELNKAQADRAAAEMAAFKNQVATIEAEAHEAQAEYARETAAYEAEKARIAAMSAEEYVQWQADVAACKVGDRSRCALPVPRP